tara:strand:- start:7096 stop:8061 length:966 start_codon:yes stop_codon:yes gene_type:complete
MSEEQESEPVELSESDLAVIDEINEERSGETEIEDNGDIDDISIETEEETSQDIDNESVEVSTPEPTISDEVRQAAQYYGLNPNDFSGEGALRNVIDQFILAEQQIYNAQQYSGQQNAQQTQQQIVDQFKVGLGDDYDEGLRDAINSLAGNIVNNFNNQLGTLQNQISYQQQFVDQAYREQSQQMAQGQLDQFNDAVASLKHKSLFGDKPFQEIDANSSEGQNMARLFDQMTVLATGYQQMGQNPPAYKQLVEQAYRALYGNEIDSLNKRRTNDRLRKQAKRRLGGGATTSKPIAPISEDPVNDPVLKEAFDGYLRENGDI